MINRSGLETRRRMEMDPRLDDRIGLDMNARLCARPVVDGAHGAGDELDHFEVQGSDVETDIGRVH